MVASGADFTFEFAWIRDGNSRDKLLFDNETTRSTF